jgi:hypothetical protein
MRISQINSLKSRRLTEEDNPFDQSHWRWWASGCVGCIGVLKDWLVDAVAATFVQHGTSLTEEVLTQTMPHPARRLSLEMEARAGERQVALHNSESAKKFQALLKQSPKKAEQTEPAPGNSPASEAREASTSGEEAGRSFPLPQVTPKPTPRRVGSRAPERDPVGEAGTTLERKNTSCPFAEVIPVTLAQMEEATLFCFECPICLAVRDTHPKEGAIVKFRRHPRRTTSTPNRGRRWVKREGAWTPSDG